mgnify:CR=1 FL=1
MRRLGPDSVKTVKAQCNLAEVLFAQGRYKEAQHFYREVFYKREGLLGRTDPETLQSKHDFAATHNDHEKAVELLHEVYM